MCSTTIRNSPTPLHTEGDICIVGASIKTLDDKRILVETPPIKREDFKIHAKL